VLLTPIRPAPLPADRQQVQPAPVGVPAAGERAPPPALTPPSAQAISALCLALTQQIGLDDSIHHLENWLREQGGASAVKLGWFEDGHARLHTDTPDAQAWLAAMEESLDQGQALHWPPDPAHPHQWVTLAQKQLAGSDQAAAMSLILPGSAEPMGALALTWAQGSPAPSAEDTLAWQALATQMAPLLAWQRQAGRPWHWHLRQHVKRKWSRGQGGLTRHPVLAWGLGLLLIGALAALPMPERIGGQGRIEGAQQRVLVATTDGFIKQVHAQPGDKVHADQVLADLAEQDLKLEHDKWASQVAQQDNAYAAAMSHGDRSEAALALSRLEEAQAQLALVEEQLQRTQLKAPFDGVLIQGDLTQSIGAPVKQGDTLMTVASTQHWRVIIEIDEAEIARVRPGQTGEIALSALPWDTLPLRVRRITPLAQAKEGRNLFEVEAEFTAPVPPEVRPGLMGPAKVRIGQQVLLWSWLRPVVERARLGLWSWWG
jgi:biotin carboxyl carrier protein